MAGRRTMWLAAGAGVGILVLAAAARPSVPGNIVKEVAGAGITALPLVPNIPAARVPNVCVVFFSGDGGWADIDQTISGVLVGTGLPVIGVDSLSWFLLGRSAGRSGRDLLKIMLYYHRILPASRFILAGYSRGADVLPFMIRRLPAEARGWIRLLALIAPAREADFQTIIIHMGPGGPPKWSRRWVRGELDLLRDVRTVGWYGTSEADTSLCTQAPEDFRAVHALPGGHHFNGNTHKHEPYLRIAAELRAEIDAALAGQ